MGNFRNLPALAGLALFAILLPCRASETNYWPFYVHQADSAVGRTDQVASLGPLFSIKDEPSRRILSIRPFWTSFHAADDGPWSGHVLYPLLNWSEKGGVDSGHALNLLQYRRDAGDGRTFFQAFPFVFLNRSPDPDSSYAAVWPFGGVLKQRLWRDRISFVLWPLYVRTERGDEVRMHFPYPFLRRLSGPHSRGFGIWPLYGHSERDNDYNHTWALWPFYYDHADKLDEPVPYERFGVLPFYTRETAAGLRSETYGWPFFGYTREGEPRPVYSENRYFWPLLVQGRGEEQYVNRWLPLFSHETRPGYAKTWILWPLLKGEEIREPGLVRERTTLLYFLYRDEAQRFAGTVARRTTLWPLAGYWNSGTGQKQLQMLDPLTVFFPRNEKVRENWSPLFALYRFDERMGNRRHSLLWDFVVWESDAAGLQAVYLGPLFEWVGDSHWDLLKGLVGSSHGRDGRRMRYFWKR